MLIPRDVLRAAVVLLTAGFLFPTRVLGGTGDTSWMSRRKYGVFLRYQYRILLGYSIKTEPQFPNPSQMTAEQWNRFVDGFDVKGFARQMAEAKVGWVLFCLDDHYFAWPCAPNKAFSDYTGYAPGEKCSRRDLILDLADAINARGGVCTLDWPNWLDHRADRLGGLDALSFGSGAAWCGQCRRGARGELRFLCECTSSPRGGPSRHDGPESDGEARPSAATGLLRLD